MKRWFVINVALVLICAIIAGSIHEDPYRNKGWFYE